MRIKGEIFETYMYGKYHGAFIFHRSTTMVVAKRTIINAHHTDEQIIATRKKGKKQNFCFSR